MGEAENKGISDFGIRISDLERNRAFRALGSFRSLRSFGALGREWEKRRMGGGIRAKGEGERAEGIGSGAGRDALRAWKRAMLDTCYWIKRFSH